MFYPSHFANWQYDPTFEDQGNEIMTLESGGNFGVDVPKRDFFDYQYQNGPDYKISFDHRSGQPIMTTMDAPTMNNKLIEIQNEIQVRMMDENEAAKQNYMLQKEQASMQKQKNLKQIMKAYAQKNSIGTFGANERVINMLQNRKVPLHRRKGSRLGHRPSVKQTDISQTHNSLQQPVIKRNLRSNRPSKSPSRMVSDAKSNKVSK